MRLFVLAIFALGVLMEVAGGVYLLHNHFDNRAEHAALLERGQEAQATAVSRSRSTDRGVTLSGRRRWMSSYFVTYRFDRNAGSHGTISFEAALEGRAQDLDLTFDYQEVTLPATKAQYDAAEHGGRVDVIFLPDTPEIVRLVRADGSFNRMNGIPWAIALFGLAGLTGWMFWQYKTTGRTF